MVEVLNDQGDGPIRRGMKLLLTNEIEVLVLFYGTSLIQVIGGIPNILLRWSHVSMMVTPIYKVLVTTFAICWNQASGYSHLPDTPEGWEG